MSKVILFVDGDNIDESYTQRIYEEAQAFGEIYEAHCFSDFVKRKQRWERAYAEFCMQLHYIPSTDKQKGKPDPNTSDIALSVLAVQKMYECPEIDACIIAANDKDYIPLAKTIREKFHKKAIMFYTQQDDRAVLSYDKAVLLSENADRNESESAEAVDEKVSQNAENELPCADNVEAAENDINDYDSFCKLSSFLSEQLSKGEYVLLAELGPWLKEEGIQYGKSLGKYLKKMLDFYPMLKEHYKLTLGNKQDRIMRIA